MNWIVVATEMNGTNKGDTWLYGPFEMQADANDWINQSAETLLGCDVAVKFINRV